MAASEVRRNYTTRHCAFAIDNEDDLRILPTSKKSGIESMSLSTPCCQGSIARATDGTCYYLSGKDEWVNGSSDSSGVGGEEVEPISNNTIQTLFE